MGYLSTGVTSQPVGDFLYTVDFYHTCLLYSKIDTCAFLFASVSLIRGSTTFCIVSDLVLKRVCCMREKCIIELISVVIWLWRWWLCSPDLSPLSLFHTLENKVTCGPRLMKHATILVVPHFKIYIWSLWDIYRQELQVSQLVTFYTLSVDFCHTCLLYSKIDMCAFLFASVSLIIWEYYFLHRIGFSAETMFTACVKNA